MVSSSFALTLGSALLAFGPMISLFSLIVYQKAQLVIVVTSAAFFFLLAALAASIFWWFFQAVGLNGPLAAIIPGVLSQFLVRCGFVALYHRVERVIHVSLEQQLREEQQQDSTLPDTTDTVVGDNNNNNPKPDTWAEVAKLRLELNDASCGIAAGVGYGGMHALLLYGTLLASEANSGVLYQESCPGMPSLIVSALYALCFSILDIFWMLLCFFGMRRRLLYHRGEYGEDEEEDMQTRRRVGAYLGNSRNGGNVALLLSLATHLVASLFTLADYFQNGCVVSIPAVFGVVLFTAYAFWAGAGRIYMPPEQQRRHHYHHRSSSGSYDSRYVHHQD